MASKPRKPGWKPDDSGSSVVVAHRDYADIVQLQNPTVVERMLTQSRSETVAYVEKLLGSGISSYIMAGPKVAVAAVTVQALSDFWSEVQKWREAGRIPEDFSGRRLPYQSWVELLAEIDTNPIDADRLKAMKAMFLAVNKPNSRDAEQILAYQLLQIAKKLSSGELLVLKIAYERRHEGGHDSAQNWLAKTANAIGHGVSALIEQHEKVLLTYGLLTPRIDQSLRVSMLNGRLTDLGQVFYQNLHQYEIQ